ncbi:hypothetical protein A2291_07225 [candidate division WOR-1 bacterium RIFOXYB2_FULL_42_35]|uniref:Uncharacterized protein n=1 Tax=candidate division WOR-1 bacterium RIFOXYC2_FULL_41_25 TaxID=1802586 RepID=A0A1F4TKI3_UNCSA|nr:MAG: hypothetical protein A2247_04565 [candidate division WOR-1 bacterium RIFOXYA2_FULL_41_14]OGC22497.1 MAG: hypothetical protein A2291_07225 [candidate division WOR-1 bacterium RIFOXYB2_FULL_42_35]OGC33235.1 MAG: hypothetical protein A2462_07400 [candidate division WOR-1 bacterium RIFOXYC2_FULL_41_25]OGC42769.1 MAG: hypothetical protein A2548_07235 [candidate division WOR-1 bacterium RIFOXYD2_FULL_41_8]
MEALGLLDTLESMILDGTKIPLTKRILINEEQILALIDKLRLVIQGGEGLAKGAIASKTGVTVNPQRGAAFEQERAKQADVTTDLEGVSSREEAKSVEILQQAYQMAKEIREGADKYADEVLANLEATSTRVLRTVKAGRERLVKK